MLASLTHRGEGQTGDWEGVSAGGRPRDLRLSGFSHLIAISPAPQGHKLAFVRFPHSAEGAQRKVGTRG